MSKFFFILVAILITTPCSFAQQTELDSLNKEISGLKSRVKKLEKAMGPGFSENYYDDIENVFLNIGYYQGSYSITDSLNSIKNYGFNLHYAEDKLSAVMTAAWGGSKFFSSFYFGYNFYLIDNSVALTPLLGGTVWGDNIWDFKEAFWSYGIAITVMDKVPISIGLFRNQNGEGFSISYKVNLKDILSN